MIRVAAAALLPSTAGAQDAAVHDPSGCLEANAVSGSDGLELFVAHDGHGYSVRLLTTDGRERTLRAPSCTQARSAAEVIVTLARAEQTAVEPLAPEAPPTLAPTVPNMVATSATATASPVRPPRRPRLRASVQADRDRRELRWHVVVSGGLAIGPGLAPEAALGAGLTTGALRVDLAAAMRTADTEALRGAADATTDVRSWLGRARVCGVLGARARVSLGLCAALELGALEAVAYGASVTSQGPRTTLWAASLGGATATVSLGDALALLAELDVGVAWTRPELVVEGAGPARQSPPYVLGARAGLELRP